MKNKILIVVAKYYKDISLGLIRSARNELISKYKVTIIEVPGVFEIPITIKKKYQKIRWFYCARMRNKGPDSTF